MVVVVLEGVVTILQLGVQSRRSELSLSPCY